MVAHCSHEPSYLEDEYEEAALEQWIDYFVGLSPGDADVRDRIKTAANRLRERFPPRAL